jgi:hypothetical protein
MIISPLVSEEGESTHSQFRSQEIIDNTPRSARPDIVQLPYECSSRVFLTGSLELTTPGSVGGTDRLGLDELSRVDVAREVEGVSYVLDEI